jgi:hypothetical protein
MLLRLFDRSDYARRAVYFHERPILPQSRRVFDARDTGNAILSRYKCAVLERAANFQNDAAGIHKKRRPSGIGRSRDEDLSFEQGFFVCGMQYLYAPSDVETPVPTYSSFCNGRIAGLGINPRESITVGGFPHSPYLRLRMRGR